MIWRWHFYAGLWTAPFLLIMSVTGVLYAFSGEIENSLYDSLFRVPIERTLRLSGDQAVDLALSQFPGARPVSYQPPFSPEDSLQVTVQPPGQDPVDVFIDPYQGSIIQTQDSRARFSARIARLHSQLLAGPLGRIVIETVAAWTVLLLVSGLYLWVPQLNFSPMGTLLPRLGSGWKPFFRDMHVVPAAWVSAGLLLWILLGLPYSILTGNLTMLIAGTTREGPHWAQADQFQSQPPEPGAQPLLWEQVVSIAGVQEVVKPFKVFAPVGERGVYSVRTFSPDPRDTVYLHLDQYSGEVLAKYSFSDMSALARAMAIGFAVHKGQMLGLPNQIFAAALAAGTFFMTLMGVVLWWSRRPQGKLGAPRRPPRYKAPEGLMQTVVVLCILFPMAGLSLLVVMALERYVVPKVPALKWLFE